jgi:probable H4MPT-linked C1 transfer pathway protein
MSAEPLVVGWDLGGAHLKLALLGADSGLMRVEQYATPLWQGMDALEEVLAELKQSMPLDECDHFLTMTAELADRFTDRAQGVNVLADSMASALPSDRLHLYAGPKGFIAPQEANQHYLNVASANWYATAAWLAHRLPQGLLVDIGSTTTDIMSFRQGIVCNCGYTDRERLSCEELIYTGVVRTPVMAIARQAPFLGEWTHLANEHFATMADVYRILGWLPADADLYPTADGRDKDVIASMRRLARMLGSDLKEADQKAWHQLAAYLADRQLDTIALACQRQFSQGATDSAPLVGAGAGNFLVRRLARRLDREYIDSDNLLGKSPAGELGPGVCAPAVAVARLGMMEVACTS